MATLYYPPFQKDESGELPPADAIEKVLPDYKYIFYDPNRKSKPVKKDQTAPARTSPTKSPQPAARPVNSPLPEPPKPSTAERAAAGKSLEQTQMDLLDHQMKELDNYRQAVHKMGKDILSLRDHIHSLEDDNSTLRHQLNRYDETRKELMATSAADFDAIDKNELIVRYMTLKQRVQAQSTENADLKDKIKRLQNEITKNNVKEKGYDEIKRAHLSQSQVLHQLQEKADKLTRLEKACLQQEKVIENMEKVLNSKKFNNEDATKAVDVENRRLREELQEARKGVVSESEKLQLYEQLEKAENRVTTLEKALAESSRSWARERQDLQTRLREAEHGFARTQSMVLHDYPANHYRHSFEPKPNSGYRSPRLDPIRRFHT